MVYVIAGSAPPVLHLSELLELLEQRGWSPCVILTPTAATWVDADELAAASGHPVRVQPRLPSDHDPLPQADAVLAAPLTFNSLNKWAAGISDTLAVGLLNELLVADLTIVAAVCAKTALRDHPAYTVNVKLLSQYGVTFLDPASTVSQGSDGRVQLDWVAVMDKLEMRCNYRNHGGDDGPKR